MDRRWMGIPFSIHTTRRLPEGSVPALVCSRWDMAPEGSHSVEASGSLMRWVGAGRLQIAFSHPGYASRSDCVVDDPRRIAATCEVAGETPAPRFGGWLVYCGFAATGLSAVAVAEVDDRSYSRSARTISRESLLVMSASARRASASWAFSCWSLWMRSSTVFWQRSLWTKTGLSWPMR